MSLTLFDWLKQITYDKKSWDLFSEEDKKTFSTYRIHKFLSQKEDYIELVNYIQSLNIQDKKLIYQIYCHFIPKKQVYLKYIKGDKKSKSKELLEKISRYYSCSNKESEEYFEILGKEGCKELLSSLGIESKEITKLLK